MKRLMFLAVLLVFSAVAFAQDSQKLPDDLNLLVGKKVIVGRMPLCQPGAYTTNLTYSGKQATVVSLKPARVSNFSNAALSRMPPEMRARMEDMHKAATLLFQFEDGVKLDSCAPMGPSKLSENLELAPGEKIEAPTPKPVVVAAAAVPSTPQECPVVVTKLSSGNSFAHQFADSMTSSQFERDLDRSAHGGRDKHYLDMRMKNAGTKPIQGIEAVVVYLNKMGDETTRDTVVSQNKNSIKPGEEYKEYTMDRAELSQNGAGETTLYINRVRFDDNTYWQDNGSHSCSMTTKVKS